MQFKSRRAELSLTDSLLNFVLFVNALNFHSVAFVLEAPSVIRNYGCDTWDLALTCLS